MMSLAEITPHLGDCMPYRYDGSSSERLRTCSVYAFHLFPEGPGEFEIEGIRHPIGKRTLFFIRPGQPHAFHVSPDRPLNSYNLYFDLWDRERPASVNRQFYFVPEPFRTDAAAVSRPCEQLDRLPGAFSLQAYPQLYDGLLAIARTFDEARHYRSETVNALLYAWLLGWYDAIHSQRPSDYRIVRLLAELDVHPERREPVEIWWRRCGLKRTYFHELFLRETGMTPKAYHHKLLMKRAAQLLRESDLSVTEIADRLGYPSIHPFTRHFGAYHGLSPREYRRNPSAGR
ncbi:helix-turn-helix transcriptional regulator [Cohnella zeiphila]|uniref:Helix-turn-helix transcriptional regulator n=1 Tax=Cohnella zeiphila TaxID=2761120 RepID=A0A7X0VYH0_9BACL|nr:AraC family transcriptional regulator [Cohnella zeiphila]MBB6735006.1 helix-turn-helix transcriptional regulator [Cohnella zeiphila]